MQERDEVIMAKKLDFDKEKNNRNDNAIEEIMQADFPLPKQAEDAKNEAFARIREMAAASENVENAEIVREKGTNRSKFFRGQIDKYTWVEAGSSYLPSELNAAYLYAQLEAADKINEKRRSIWNRYWDGLEKLSDEGKIIRPTIPEGCVHNAHMFYLKARDLEERTALISYLKEQGVQAVFHYIPLHTAPAGRRYGMFAGEDRYTTRESERLVRLPLYYNLSLEQADYVIDKVNAFYKER